MKFSVDRERRWKHECMPWFHPMAESATGSRNGLLDVRRDRSRAANTQTTGRDLLLTDRDSGSPTDTRAA